MRRFIDMLVDMPGAVSEPLVRRVIAALGLRAVHRVVADYQVVDVVAHDAGTAALWDGVRTELDVTCKTVRPVNGGQVAKTWESSAKALNSNALPAGSSRNIVHCSPACPAKRT